MIAPNDRPAPTDELVKHMVNRFLSWRLPENFMPDGGISFKRTFNENTPHPMKHEPVGTNLFDHTQATEMVRYMLEGFELSSPSGQAAPPPPTPSGSHTKPDNDYIERNKQREPVGEAIRAEIIALINRYGIAGMMLDTEEHSVEIRSVTLPPNMRPVLTKYGSVYVRTDEYGAALSAPATPPADTVTFSPDQILYVSQEYKEGWLAAIKQRYEAGQVTKNDIAFLIENCSLAAPAIAPPTPTADIDVAASRYAASPEERETASDGLSAPSQPAADSEAVQRDTLPPTRKEVCAAHGNEYCMACATAVAMRERFSEQITERAPTRDLAAEAEEIARAISGVIPSRWTFETKVRTIHDILARRAKL